LLSSPPTWLYHKDQRALSANLLNWN
jgi:hypothetical protein